jgi:hypothetical protein
VRYCKESDLFSRKLVFEYLVFENLPDETFFEHLYGKDGKPWFFCVYDAI